MITTVKNNRGYLISLANLFISLACTVAILSLGYFQAPELRSRWWMVLGLATSLLTFLDQSMLILKRKSYTRLSGIRKYLFLGYIISFLSCIVVPTLMTKEYASLDAAIIKPTAFNVFIIFAVNILPLYIVALSLFFSHSQMIQNLLHPYTEIIDGFAKSSGSIQMTSIPSNNSLKEVVIANDKDSAAELESSRESILSSNKADGSSPKPSKVLKTWPKADPFPVRALYSFKTSTASELPFKKGDTITVLDCRGRWWQAQKEDRIGFIPSNYVSVLQRARVISSFVASEDDQVSVKKDEIIEVMEKYEEKCLIRNVEDKIGAVPSSKLEFISE